MRRKVIIVYKGGQAFKKAAIIVQFFKTLGTVCGPATGETLTMQELLINAAWDVDTEAHRYSN